MTLSTNKIKQIYTLLGQLGIRDQKEDLVSDASGGRTDSVRELRELEADGLIKHLRQFTQSSNLQPATRNLQPGNNIRRSIMSMAYTLGIISQNMTNSEKMAALNEYIKNHPKTAKDAKPLMDMSIAELQALHFQFNKFMMSKLSK